MSNRIWKPITLIVLSLVLTAGLFSPAILSVKAEEVFLPEPDESGLIKLYDDVKLNKGRIYNEDITLDLNGHFLTAYSGETLKITGGTFTIIDSSLKGTGQIRNNCTTLDYAAVLVQGGTVNLRSGTIGECNSDCVQVYSGAFNMYGGKLFNLHGTAVMAHGGNFNLYDGTIETKFTGILFGGSGKMSISGGKFKRLTGGFSWTSAIVSNHKSFNMSGNPSFEGFTADVQLRKLTGDSGYPKIILTDKLTTSELKINVQDIYDDPADEDLPVVITEGLKNYGTFESLVCVQENNGSYALVQDNNGEAVLVKAIPITFHANDGTDVVAVQSAVTASEGECTTLNSNPFTREHYSFDSWNTKADGSGISYKENASIVVTGPLDLYAIWDPVPYSITYNLEGGRTEKENPTEFTVETETFTLNDPIRDGYEFLGWCLDGETEPVKPVTIEKGSAFSRTYTAVWKIITYTITYDLDGGTLAEDNPAEYTVETETFTLNNPEKEGVVFIGWSLDNDPVPVRTVTIEKGSIGNRTYKAVWDRKTPPTGDTFSHQLLTVLMLTSLAGFTIIRRRKH